MKNAARVSHVGWGLPHRNLFGGASPTLLLLSLFIAGAATAAEPQKLTYVDLVKRLADLERLALLPAPGEKCAQWSSYDRKSRYDEATGQYVGWDANGDGNGFIRKEGDQFVFAEMEGPGCIWRIWSARPEQGHVRIYLDGAKEPVVDLPFKGYFDGKNEPFTRSALVHTVAMGWNNYTPIPYQKSCKIVADPKWGAYFQFVYTTYPKGTQVPMFKRQLSAEENAALDEANQILSKGGPAPAGTPAEVTNAEKTVTIEPGDRFVAALDGPRAVTGFGVNGKFDNREDEIEALRDIVLQITWDDEDKPAVWSPLGDFFGSAPGVNLYRSFPLGMTKEGYYCNWYMPYATSVKFEFINEGKKPRTLDLWATYEPLKRPIEQFGRFHAKWHRDAFLPEDPVRRKIDWTMLKTQGRGRFCGVMLHVWNPRGGWWGEGDEKFFVDGEKFPSTIGTGSEDYFGYAWCNPTLFANCYHDQTISNNNKGHVSVNRWHIPDNIPFQQSFEAAIEKYYPNSKPTLYAATVYWYQGAGQKDPYEPVPVGERKGYWGPIEVAKIKGALEGEELKILRKTAGNPAPQDMSGYNGTWSNESHLWWTDAKPGDTLDLAVPVEKAGTYRLKMQLTKAIDYGIVQLSLDGKKLGGTIDLFNRGVVATGVLDMGTHDLSQGQHVLRVEIVGANEKAVKGYMFGLDYVKLEDVAASLETPNHVAPPPSAVSDPVSRASRPRIAGRMPATQAAGPQDSFYLPENLDYTILDSAKDSVRFTVERTLVEYKGHLSSKSSFVDKDGNIMNWHDFGNLEGPGWAANAVGGAYELYAFGRQSKDPVLQEKALSVLDHILEGGFINHETGFITGYRETTTDKFCLNYQHKNNWFCPGSMAKIAYQLLIFSDLVDGPRKVKMQSVAIKTADWIHRNVRVTVNGWYPRRCQPDGEHYPQNAYGDSDILFEKSADGLFIIQLNVALTQRGLADYKPAVQERVKVFMERGGLFGSINHDTYDEHENVAYSVAFRTLRQAAKLLSDEKVRAFAYDKCLAGLDQFKMTDDRHGVATKGLLYMERSWDTAYLWESAEAALAYFEAYQDTGNDQYKQNGLTILRAIAKHHQRDTGFLTEGVDWNNHVGKQHHFDGAEYGDIKYTEPFLNNLHIVEPTLLAIRLRIAD